MGKKGGAETVYSKITSGLAKRGHNVVRSYCDPNLDDGEIRKVNGDVYFKLLPSRLLFFRDPKVLYQTIKSIYKLYNLIRYHNPDLVYFHFFKKEFIIFSIVRALIGCKLVIGFQGSDITSIDRHTCMILRASLSVTDRIVTGSKFLMDEIILKTNYNSDNIRVIYNGFDNSIWNSRSIADRNTKHLISVGALRQVKGHDILIRAFADIHRKHPEALLTIVGDGEKREEYESLISSLGLEKQVKLTGWLPQEKVKKELERASLFVFPSRNEGFGIALLEAMSCGVPVVASRVGGIPEVTSGTNAILVPPDDPLVLSSVLADKLTDLEWQRVACRSARQRARHFSWHTAVSEYEDVFERVVA